MMKHSIPLSHIQLIHVISYQHKLVPIILTHCHYSLQYGKGSEVKYDLQAIEKDIFEKFIFGKPKILTDDIPRVLLRNFDTFFGSIRAKVRQVQTAST